MRLPQETNGGPRTLAGRENQPLAGACGPPSAKRSAERIADARTSDR